MIQLPVHADRPDEQANGFTEHHHPIKRSSASNTQNPIKIKWTPVQARRMSFSPPTVRITHQSNEQPDRRTNSPQRKSLIIRRRSWQLNAGNVENQHAPHAIDSATPITLANCRTRVTSTPSARMNVDRAVVLDRSIPSSLALTPSTKAISIVIGGTSTDTTGSRDSGFGTGSGTRTPRDSPQLFTASPHRRVASPAAAYDLGVRIDRPSPSSIGIHTVRVRSPFSGPSITVQSVDSQLRHQVVHTLSSPVTVGVSSPGVLISRTAPTDLGNTGQTVIRRRNSFTASRPPLPKSNSDPTTATEPSGQKAFVRISTSPGYRGLVITTSPSSDRKSQIFSLIAPSAAVRTTVLRPSGSCDNLSSHRIQLDIQPRSGEFVRHPVIRSHSSVERRSLEIPTSHLITPRCDMPNAPVNDGLGAFKTSCRVRSSSTDINDTMSTEQSSPWSADAGGNIFGMSPLLLPSNAKPVHGASAVAQRSRTQPQKYPGVKQSVNSGQYSRVQLPCTRSSARSKGFVVTDSLKLYEDQIFRHFDPSQRPQSWCIDLAPTVDDVALIDDSHSTSPASTVSSSYSSSSSSDAPPSPSYRNVRLKPTQIDRACTAAPTAHMCVSRWPVDLNSSKPPINSFTDDGLTPTSTPTGNGSIPFLLESESEPQFPRRISEPAVIDQLYNKPPVRNAGMAYDQLQYPSGNAALPPKHTYPPKSSSPTVLTTTVPDVTTSPLHSCPTGPASNLGSLASSASGFETVRPNHLAPSVMRHTEVAVSHFHSPPSDPDQSSHPWGTNATDIHLTDRRFSCPASTSTSSTTTLSGQWTAEEVSPTAVGGQPPTEPPITFQSPSNSTHSSSTSWTVPDSIPPPIPWRNDADYVCDDRSGGRSPSLFEPNASRRSGQRSSSSKSSNSSGRSGLTESDVFTNATPLLASMDYHKANGFDGTSDHFDSSLTEESTYAFSTLDSEYLAWMRLSVRDVTGMPEVTTASNPKKLTAETLETISRVQVHHWVDLFNSNPLGLRLNFVDDSCRLAGTLRIHINLIRPVKMSLRQTMDMMPTAIEPSSENTPFPSNGTPEQGPALTPPTPPAPARLVSFFLPRGTSKVVYITSSTTSVNAIQSLLDRFHIQESSRKFALYEHTLEQKTIVTRKLAAAECPLLVLLNWVRISSNRDEFFRRLHQKRIVLQENDGCDIDWSEFTAPELMNFIRILDKEEAEYRNAINFQYGQVIKQVQHQIKAVELEKSIASTNITTTTTTNGPNYARIPIPTHPHAFQPNSEHGEYCFRPVHEDAQCECCSIEHQSNGSKSPAASV